MTNIISHGNKNTPLSNSRRAVHSGRLFFLIAIIMLVGYILGILTPMAFSSPRYDERQFAEQTIAAGDTLWSIAANYCDENTNVQKFMHEIAEFNQLDSNCSLFPGQTLKIPIAAAAKRN